MPKLFSKLRRWWRGDSEVPPLPGLKYNAETKSWVNDDPAYTWTCSLRKKPFFYWRKRWSLLILVQPEGEPDYQICLWPSLTLEEVRGLLAIVTITEDMPYGGITIH